MRRDFPDFASGASIPALEGISDLASGTNAESVGSIYHARTGVIRLVAQARLKGSRPALHNALYEGA